jgi:hypothetical protein
MRRTSCKLGKALLPRVVGVGRAGNVHGRPGQLAEARMAYGLKLPRSKAD